MQVKILHISDSDLVMQFRNKCNFVFLCEWYHLKSVQRVVSLPQLWYWPSARPLYVSLANRALLPVDPSDSQPYTWHAPPVSLGAQWCKDMKSEACSSVERPPPPGLHVWSNDAPYEQDASGFRADRPLSGHLFHATGTDEPAPPPPGSNARA